MKKFICILITLNVLHAAGQTFNIAHKSHSGDPSQVSYEGTDRFGEYVMPPVLVKVERIQTEDEQATLFHYVSSMRAPYVQRVDEHPVFNAEHVNLDSLKTSMQWENVEWIGFDEPEIEEEKKKKKGFVLPFSFGPRHGLFLFAVFFGLLLSFSRKRDVLWS